MRSTSEEIPRIGLISRAQFLLLLCGSLSILCGCAGFMSPGISLEPAVEEHFQISDVVFAGKVLRFDTIKHPKGRYKESATDSQDVTEEQLQSSTQKIRGACGPREPTALEQLDEFFKSIPWHYSGGVSKSMWSGTLKIEFEVYESWKGKTFNNLTVLTKCPSESCRYRFDVGDTWVVFACWKEVHDSEEVDVTKYLWTDLYWANKNLDDSPESKSVIKQLNALKSGLLQVKTVGSSGRDLEEAPIPE